MFKRSVLWTLLTTLTALGAAAWMSPPASGSPNFTASVVCAAPTGSAWATLLQGFQQDVSQRTQGRLQINLTFGASPGSEVLLVQQVIAGTTHQGGVFTTAALAQGADAPRVAIAELPYLFLNTAEVDHILDTVIKADITADLHSKGLTFGGWSENGWLHIAARTKVFKTPKNFKNVPLRHQPSAIHQSILSALSASPQALSLDQVGPQLQGASIEGLESSVQYLEVAGWAPIQKVSQTGHAFQPGALVWADSFWDTLPPDIQAELLGAQGTLTTNTRATLRAQEATAITALTNQGVTFHALSAAEKDVLKQTLQGTHTTFSQQSAGNAALLQAVVNALATLRN